MNMRERERERERWWSFETRTSKMKKVNDGPKVTEPKVLELLKVFFRCTKNFQRKSETRKDGR